MGHEAIANWFNTEIAHDNKQIPQLIQQIQRHRTQQELKLVGTEYSLFINQDEVMVRANHLMIDDASPLEDDFHYYDEESIAFCGTDDFLHFLHVALTFIDAY